LWAVLWASALLGALPASAEQRLKYRFEPGDRLVYERRTVIYPLESDQRINERIEQVQVWCLSWQAGEWLMLVEVLRAGDGQSEPTAGAVFYLHESGRRRIPPEMAPQLGMMETALELLPVLPLPVQDESAWVAPPDLYEQRWRYTACGADTQQGGHRRFAVLVEDLTGVNDVAERKYSGAFWLDPTACVVTRLESELREGREKRRQRSAAVLRHRERMTPAWAARRAEEAERYLRALRHEERLLHMLIRQPGTLPEMRSQLDHLWSALRSDMDARAGSPFVRLAEGRRRHLQTAADVLAARAALGQRWLDKPARPWTLQDPTGRTVTSENLRGRVVIECYWSAESLWGLRSLESFRRTARAVAAQSVTVLCLNMDFDLPRARLVVERCGVGLSHVMAGPLQDVEGLSEWPVVRVVDQAGVVRGLWVGWQPDYAAAAELARTLANRN